MTIALCKSDTVLNVDEENVEPSENFLIEIRTYLEEQKSKNSTERNSRQISGGKH